MNSLSPSLRRTADYILGCQLPSGAVPWFEDGIIDPWDHTEALMGLSVIGAHDAARAGFKWLKDRQREDGAWFAAYQGDEIADATRAETNFVGYVASGLWHAYLASGDKSLLSDFWPMTERAMNWVVSLQAETGEIYWAKDTVKGIDHDALITGCSSIFGSLGAAIQIGDTLGADTSPWEAARSRLLVALQQRPDRFDRTWPSKDRYSMDWFYPVLTGVYTGAAASDRLDSRWTDFVVPDLGCKCVEEEPWVTVAETCELIMACTRAGQKKRALTLWQDIQQFQLEDGSWWTGWVYRDQVHWPDERPTWTAAAILLAADALFDISSASGFFKNPG